MEPRSSSYAGDRVALAAHARRGGVAALALVRVPARLIAVVWVTAWGLVGLAAARLGSRLRGTAAVPRIGGLQRAWAARVLRILGARLEVEGVPAPAELLVTNHLSYVDVLVLSSQLDAVFVAKSEIASWPLVGPVCRSVQTLFVDRERRRDIPAVVAAIERASAEGRTIVIFPEGTSTDGSHVLPFKPSLLESAARAGWRVGYAALQYRTPLGAPPPAEAVCWWRDMTFLPHVLRLMALPGFTAVVRFGERPVVDSDRKRLAGRLWQAVRTLAPAR